MFLPASTACSGVIRESARVQELLVKLDRTLNKLLHTSSRLSTRPRRSELGRLTLLWSLIKDGPE